jgi:hypothetical protein
VLLNLLPAQHAALKERAVEHGMTLTGYLRRIVLDDVRLGEECGEWLVAMPLEHGGRIVSRHLTQEAAVAGLIQHAVVMTRNGYQAMHTKQST